jgi:hypothetical protein
LTFNTSPKGIIAIKHNFKMNLPTNKITFLRDVPSNIKVDMTSG